MHFTRATSILSLTVFIVALAACGGGSGSSPTLASAVTTAAEASSTNAATVAATTTVAASTTTMGSTATVTTAPPPTNTPTATGSDFALTSSVGAAGGLLPADFTCDGTSSSPPLAWANAPSGTKEFVLLMTTVPTPGSLKYNWVLSGIPASATQLARNSTGVGVAGVGSDGPTAAYQAPCSQGPGQKQYIFTIFALSAAPALAMSANAVTGPTLASAIASLTLASSALNLNYTRGTTTTTPPLTAVITDTTPQTTTAAVNCQFVGNSLAASTTGVATSTCDSTYAYIASNGLATHSMMNGIVATNLQVPVAQNFSGANAWKIPLAPAIATATTTAVDGPIGVAINGVPIFNPCKQGGCQNGDTKVLGELDVCNGHAGRADDYHYHAAPTCLMAAKPASYWDTHPLGWALDGFAIYGYNNADGAPAARDSICGGNTSATQNGPTGYSYHVTDTSPYVLSCFRGTPSPDLSGQGAKYSPIRRPPVTPFPVASMALMLDATDGYQVLQFASNQSFVTTSNGADSFNNSAGGYNIRFKQLGGAELSTALANNVGKAACWTFMFTTRAGLLTQPNTTYCR